MKKSKGVLFAFVLVIGVIAVILIANGTFSNKSASQNTSTKSSYSSNYSSPSSNYSSPSSNYSSPSSSSKSYSSFTNRYGTPTTKCAHTGCNNYIASSGDTNCCTTHSNHCLECGKYIDEDALYCISCLEKALKDNNG